LYSPKVRAEAVRLEERLDKAFKPAKHVETGAKR
jgi:hypothetical protein